MKAYQLILAGFAVFSFTISAVTIFLPKPARPALHPAWMVVLVGYYAAYVWLLYKCGAFSTI